MSDDNSIRVRLCKKCQLVTPCTDRGVCKPCDNARAAAWRAANPERKKAVDAAWRAENREKTKRDQSKNENTKRYRSEWAKRNPEKVKAKYAAWKEKNPERAKANLERWRKNHPETKRVYNQNRLSRKSANGGVLSTDLPKKLFKLQKGKCPCCGAPLGDDYHLDHIVPLALGGANTDDNIQLLTATCNQQKHAKHPVDFMQSRGFLL